MPDPLPNGTTTPPPTVTVTTTGPGAGPPAPGDTFFWGRSIDTTAKALIAILLTLAASYGFIQGLISGEGFIGVVVIALGWYNRPAQNTPSTEVKTTSHQTPTTPGAPNG